MFPCLSVSADEDGATSISSVHPDIISSHILNRLDGPSLACLSSASSQLHTLSDEDTLWREVCHSTWPSSNHIRMRQLISNFPNRHRSLFSDSFPLLITFPRPPPEKLQSCPSPAPMELISAVDIRYKDKLIFSEVQETPIHSRIFHCSPFRIDLLDPKDVVPTPVQLSEDISQNLGEDLTLSWIMVIGQKAANFSSCRPVSVHKHWLTEDINLKFATILSVEQELDVLCEITVTFEKEMEISEVSMHVEDMDGNALNGESTLEILQRAILTGDRIKDRSKERTERYLNYMKKTRERKMRTQWRSTLYKMWNFLMKLVCFMFFSKT
ncbi:hypothetical protein ACHQM5_016196 [Ranunculus cassubicifolius]